MPEEKESPASAVLHPQDAAAQPVKLPAKGTVLAFDFGLLKNRGGHRGVGNRTGFSFRRHCARSQCRTFLRPSRHSLMNGNPYSWSWAYRSLSGDATPMSARCRRFTNQLNGRFNLPVAVIDERLTSVEAEAQLQHAGVSNWQTRKNLLDSTAAQILLQNFRKSIAMSPKNALPAAEG